MDTGGLSKPYPWQPSIVPLQLLRIGQLVVIAVPGEFTTMAGRRLRNSVSKVNRMYTIHRSWIYSYDANFIQSKRGQKSKVMFYGGVTSSAWCN